MYTSDPTSEAVLGIFATKNAERTGQPAFRKEDPISNIRQLPNRKLGMVPVPSYQFIYNYTLFNPNVTYWGMFMGCISIWKSSSF